MVASSFLRFVPRHGTVALSVALASASASSHFNSNNNSSNNNKLHPPCILNQKHITQNDSFQVYAALEVKEELEKVRLAQLIHDLHLLATKNNQKKEKKGTNKKKMRKYVTMFRRRTTEEEPLQFQCGTIQQEGRLSLPNNLKKIKPDECESLLTAIKAGGQLSWDSFDKLLQASKKALLQEPTVVDLPTNKNVVVVGDLHGDLSSLSTVLRLARDIPDQIVVFDGDFVDRGTDSLAVLTILLLLKLTYPDKVYLLRGNHEDSLIASVYGFQDEVRRVYGNHEAMWHQITSTFACMPVAATTASAVIVHGGIPSFDDWQALRQVSPAQRSKVLTMVVEDRTDTEALFQTILWSDPDPSIDSVQPNPRGCGLAFGPAVAADVLKHIGKQYLIRGHQAMEKGLGVVECNDAAAGKVLTVFSAAAYPAGKGTNWGAILTLDPQGGYTTTTFKDEKNNQVSQGVETIRALIGANKAKLEDAFGKVENMFGYVSFDQWCQVLGETLDLPNMPWKVMQPALAPDMTMGMISVRTFLGAHTIKELSEADANQVAELHANHQMLLTVFKFLDVDGSGDIDLTEFKTGVELLNRHLPEERKLKDPDHLFQVLDKDGSGEIDFEEFEQVFEVM